MKFKELSIKWKVTLVTLAVFTTLFITIIGVFSVFLNSYRKSNANMRDAIRKSDGELIGMRFEVPREHKKSVNVNVYIPNNPGKDKLPVLFNIHGGGFVGGDADVLDTQSDRIANEWNVIVVTVNYTKADVESIAYGAEEIKDTVLYFANNANTYNADEKKFSVMGYSAGAFYSAEATKLLEKSHFNIESLILCYPWTVGLRTKDLNQEWPATLFILAGQDPISQKAKSYVESMKDVGIQTEVKEYKNAVHSFIESNNPEGQKDTSVEMKDVINPEQESLARQAENDIKEWIDSITSFSVR